MIKIRVNEGCDFHDYESQTKMSDIIPQMISDNFDGVLVKDENGDVMIFCKSNIVYIKPVNN